MQLLVDNRQERSRMTFIGSLGLKRHFELRAEAFHLVMCHALGPTCEYSRRDVCVNGRSYYIVVVIFTVKCIQRIVVGNVGTHE